MGTINIWNAVVRNYTLDYGAKENFALIKDRWRIITHSIDQIDGIMVRHPNGFFCFSNGNRICIKKAIEHKRDILRSYRRKPSKRKATVKLKTRKMKHQAF